MLGVETGSASGNKGPIVSVTFRFLLFMHATTTGHSLVKALIIYIKNSKWIFGSHLHLSPPIGRHGEGDFNM